MVKLLSIRTRIEDTISSYYTFMTANFWVFVGWVASTYMLPVQTVAVVMIIMVLLDLFSGIWKSLKQGEKFKSKKIWNTVEKFILYYIGLISSFVLETHIGIDIIRPLWLFSTLIIVREYVSVLENIEIITGTRLLAVIKKQLAKIFPDAYGSDTIEPKNDDSEEKENQNK